LIGFNEGGMEDPTFIRRAIPCVTVIIIWEAELRDRYLVMVLYRYTQLNVWLSNAHAELKAYHAPCFTFTISVHLTKLLTNIH
jgi:hypothetical protein